MTSDLLIHQTIRLGHGGTRPRLKVEALHLAVTKGPDQGLSIALDLPEIRVGTAPENELALGDPAVSRVHFTIRREGAALVLTDTGSTNGTRVNGALTRSAVLEPGVAITLGSTTLMVRQESHELLVPPPTAEAFHGVLGSSPAMRELFSYLEAVARTPLSVVLQGETGCGKELIARSVHDASPRAKGSFVIFDCGTADPNLVGSALFGHAAGAFTGAASARKGAFQSADGGTLFLDEIGELPLELQPRLLRALERGEVQPLGTDAPLKVDVRVVCATHRNLVQMVADGKFREDLLHRLSGVVLILPPLRERPGDIGLLARHFLRATRPDLKLGADALGVLEGAPWPGNVRELRNVIERSAALAKGPELAATDVLVGPIRPGAAAKPPTTGLGGVVGHAEAEAIRRVLKECKGNKSEAARKLGIARTTLRKKMGEYGIDDSEGE